MTTRRRRLLRPWMFVLLGVALSVCSALLVHQLLTHKAGLGETLTAEAARLERQIEQEWQRVRGLEQEEHTGTLLLLFSALSQGKDAPSAKVALAWNRYVEKILLSGRLPPDRGAALREKLAEKDGSAEALKEVFALVDKERVAAMESINGLYARKEALAQQQSALERETDTLWLMALLFQMGGLILVLAKDLARPRA